MSVARFGLRTRSGQVSGLIQTPFTPIVTNGLVLNLDAADSLSYPGTGTTWTDTSGNGNNGTLTNGPTFNSANGGSIVFDGVNDFILGPSAASLNFGTGNFTACAWFKTNTSLRRTILSRFDFDGTGTIERGYYIDVLANGKIRCAIETNGFNYRATDSNTVVNTNIYFNVAISRTDQVTLNVYINGLYETTNLFTAGSPSNINAITAPFTIARLASYQAPFSGANSFIGNIPNVTIYNRALSDSEILQNFNALKNRYL